jgi:hypothetical protein
MRAAWTQSPTYTSVFWLGDQMVSWDKHDGIKSVLVGMLSSGIGGHALTHSDIGGYTMVFFFFKYLLYLFFGFYIIFELVISNLMKVAI